MRRPDVEDILEDSARKVDSAGVYVADPGNPTTTTNFGAGHGLVDAIKALEDSRVLGGSGLGSPQPQVPSRPDVYQGGQADPQASVHSKWVAPVGIATKVSERFLVSANATNWPVGVGSAANFRVVSPGGAVTNMPTSALADTTAGTVRIDTTLTFTLPGAYSIEPQIDFGLGLVAFDSFLVHVS